MNNFKHLKNVLEHNIKKLAEVKSIFCENAETDFTRERKLGFETVISDIICMESGSLKDELFKLNDHSPDTPTASAFVQARSKIKADVFVTLYNQFNDKTHKDKLYKGYRLIAIDGSEIPIDSSNKYEDTYVMSKEKNMKPFAAFHLNSSYDLLECTYDDLIIQGESKKDENDAFCKLVDRYKGKKAIFIADRNYESYNGFEHVVHSGNKYLIRVRDITSKQCMTQSLGPYPNRDEFDINVSRALTLKQTKMTKACSYYRFLPANTRFDYMDKENPFYEFNCRIVRFEISEGRYETIITNLDREEISAEEIKDLYNKRWGIETSFRELKYALDLNALHSKKRNLIKQEIYARMLLYNFSQRVIQKVKINKKERQKYKYQVNYTRAFHIIRHFLTKTDGKNPPVDDLIAKEILPIRPGRSDERHVLPKHVVCFNYRYD